MEHTHSVSREHRCLWKCLQQLGPFVSPCACSTTNVHLCGCTVVECAADLVQCSASVVTILELPAASGTARGVCALLGPLTG